jgi:chemotaxis protein histidine kinase CheA
MENIRAYMLTNKLKEMGVVNRTIPANLENNAEASVYIVENGFYISFTTSMFREQIETAAKGTLSVESVAFMRRMPDESEDTSEIQKPQRDDIVSGEPAIASIPMKQNLSSMNLTNTNQDSLLDLAGEIIVNESMITELADLADSKSDHFEKAARRLSKLADALQDTLMLPICSCIGIRMGDAILSIPITNIRECFQSSEGQLISDAKGNEMIRLRGDAYPLIRLHESFDAGTGIGDIDKGVLILVAAGGRMGCLFADELIGQFRVVVKPLPPYLDKLNVRPTGISGCTIMGNDKISLVIDVQELLS